MEYAYAVLLLHGGNENIDEQNIREILEVAGYNPDIQKIKATIAALENVDINAELQSAAIDELDIHEDMIVSNEEGNSPESSGGLKNIFSR